jgi:hypothetical protein
MSADGYILVAVDPGAEGGIAIRWPDGVTEARPMPKTLPDMLDMWRGIVLAARVAPHVLIEDPGLYVNEKAPRSVLLLHQRVGELRGACLAFECTVEMVRPQQWQKFIPNLPRGQKNKTKRKNRTKGFAQEMFGDPKTTHKTGEAYCILYYGMRSRGLA